MGSYAENIAGIRNARLEKQKEKDALYKLQMRWLAVKKELKKKSAQDIIIDDNTSKAINDLQGELITLKEKLSKIEAALLQHESLKEKLQAKLSLEKSFKNEIDEISAKMSAIDEELQQNIDAETREELNKKRRQLEQVLLLIKQKLESVQEEIAALEHQIAEGQQGVETLKEQQREVSDRIKRDQERLKEITSNVPGREVEGDSDENKIKAQSDILKGKDQALSDWIGQLFGHTTPEQLIAEWNDQVPIMLFPLRLETKFNKDQLWVRIFPDDVAVITHEKILTQQELEYGIAYWKALWQAKADEDKKKTAWRMLADKFGPNRSAWIAMQTKPGNWKDAAILAGENELNFPVHDLLKPGSWTEAPHTNIVPDKFVIIGYRNNKQVYTHVGNQVSDILTLGPSPVLEGSDATITRDKTTNRLEFGEDFKWVTDFNLAVDKGMGFKIPLTGEYANGFDQLLVIGIKLSADETDGKQLVETLIDNHHYSRKGFALVNQGTPTNNTEGTDAGFSTTDPLQNTSYWVETGKELFKETDDKKNATDGQRLAEYLGIDYAPLQYIANSDKWDGREAVAMNKALYGSTIGYYLHSMLNEVMEPDAIARLSKHFTELVTGRGPIASIRVGNQPYGILPVSDFGNWKYPQRGGLGGALRHDTFYPALYKFLFSLDKIWSNLIPQLAHISKPGSAGANLIEVLGLHPTSQEFFQRLGCSFDHLKNLEVFKFGHKYFWDAVKMFIERDMVMGILKQFGYVSKPVGAAAKPIPMLLQLIFLHGHTKLDPKNLIDGLPLSEQQFIKPYKDELNYIHWLLNADAKVLEAEDFGGVAKPTSLLYMLLRHSLLMESSHSIHGYLSKNNIIANELIRSRKFMNITSAPSISHWEVFNAPVKEIVQSEDITASLYNHIHSSAFAAGNNKLFVHNLEEFKWALGILKDMRTARLERTMVEHLDTLTYRLDAWQTSIFDQRLRQQRRLDAPLADRKKGVYIGAYGYLEGVKRQAKRSLIPEDVLPEPLREHKNNLFVEQGNGGYIHAPTLNHATAAAILRNGYLTHAKPEDQEVFSVNLSSERVRRAQYLIEGIRNGQTLEVLLGYQFERGLHEWTTRKDNPVILNDLIPVFRAKYPIKKTKVPQKGNVTGPEETVNDYHVTNGLELARSTLASPYGITPPSPNPPFTIGQLDAIKQVKENLANTLDALRDVLTSESAYQLALGNFDRAAAVVQAISGSEMPPDIEVINSSRGTSLSFTNRVAIHFDPTISSNPWAPIVMTERAKTEAGMNSWIAELLGNPSNIRCHIKEVDDKDNILSQGVVTLADLKVQPLDFVYLIRNKLEETGVSELETRVRYCYARQKSLPDSAIVKIEFANSNDASAKSFFEVLPFANYIREMISGAKPLGARDYVITSKEITTPGDNPNQVNLTDLGSRIGSVFSNFTNLFDELDSALTTVAMVQTETTINDLRDKLVNIANAGFVFAFPQSATGFSLQEIDTLTAQGESLLTRFATLKKKYNENLAKVNAANTKPPQKISLLTEMVKSMLGEDFILLPRFTYSNITEVTTAQAGSAQLLKYAKFDLANPYSFPVEEWLHGVSLVRRKMHNLEMVRLLNDSLNPTSFNLEPIQIPYRDKDSWLAVEFPENTTIDHDTLSFVHYIPQGFDTSREQCGLLIDDWTESIPTKEEVTGITFNYNQPNTVPPQTLLLAIAPKEQGHWTWNGLVGSVMDTFRRAKLRAVEPDRLDTVGAGFTTLFPALISEFSTSKASVSMDYSMNLDFVFQNVMTLSSNKI